MNLTSYPKFVNGEKNNLPLKNQPFTFIINMSTLTVKTKKDRTKGKR